MAWGSFKSSMFSAPTTLASACRIVSLASTGMETDWQKAARLVVWNSHFVPIAAGTRTSPEISVALSGLRFSEWSKGAREWTHPGQSGPGSWGPTLFLGLREPRRQRFFINTPRRHPRCPFPPSLSFRGSRGRENGEWGGKLGDHRANGVEHELSTENHALMGGKCFGIIGPPWRFLNRHSFLPSLTLEQGGTSLVDRNPRRVSTLYLLR